MQPCVVTQRQRDLPEIRDSATPKMAERKINAHPTSDGSLSFVSSGPKYLLEVSRAKFLDSLLYRRVEILVVIALVAIRLIVTA